jgi:P4 family phage/plasmid primase-like protien
MMNMIDQIKTHPILLCVVRDKETGELDKQQIAFFKNDFKDFFKNYPELELVKKPDGSAAKPFSIHYFPHLTVERCQELRTYVKTNREKILKTKQGIINKLKEMYEILSPDICSTESMDTTVIQQLDVDHESVLGHPFLQKIMLKNPPYYLSSRYKLPKIFVKVRNMPPDIQNRLTHTNENGKSVLELLCGQNSYRDMTTPIENIENPIPEIEFDELIQEFPDMGGINRPPPKEGFKAEPSLGGLMPLPSSTELLDCVLDNLDPDRAIEYKKWFAIMCAIYNCFDDKEVACKKAQEWSKKSPKYDETKWKTYGKDRQMFLRLYNSRGGFHTLRYYLKQDNPELYKQIFPTKASTLETNPYISRLEKHMIFKFSQKTVADLFASMPISKNYVFCGQFYEFNGVLYKPETSLSHRIYEMIEPILSNFLFDLEKEDKEDKAIYALLHKYVKEIGQRSFLNGVKKLLQYHLQDDEFVNRLDTDLNLLAFEDCVYDLTIRDFRPTTPKDCISKSVGYNRPKLNPTIRKELEDCFHSLFDEKDVYDYMRALNATCLFRGNANSLFPIWTGRGSNGKSTFMNLKQKALGMYSYTLPVSTLTSEVKNHGTSDFPKIRGCRHVRVDEPKKTSRILSNTIKVMTGGDPMTCRGMFKESITFTVSAVFELLSNAMPLMDSYDYAVGRRLAPIPYIKQFLNETTKEVYNENNKNHRYRDDDLKTKLESKEYYQQYILMMIDDYVEFFKDKEVMPTTPLTIKKTAIEYEEDNTESQDISGWFYSTYEFVSEDEYNNDVKGCRKNYGKTMKQMLGLYKQDTSDRGMDDREFQLAFKELEGYDKVITFKRSSTHYLIKWKQHEEEESNQHTPPSSSTILPL